MLERLPLHGDETVIDAGCGSGRVTRLLLDRLPLGHVIAVDAAPSMTAEARQALDDRATVITSDLVDLLVDKPADAAFSNAVFHWVPDHDALFGRLFDSLKPGAPLVAQCGGQGNIEAFHRAARQVGESARYKAHLGGWEGPWNFASPQDTAERLRRAGFEDVRTWLEPSTVRPPEPATFVRVVCLGHHLDSLPEELREPYVVDVMKAYGEPMDLHYVRPEHHGPEISRCVALAQLDRHSGTASAGRTRTCLSADRRHARAVGEGGCHDAAAREVVGTAQQVAHLVDHRGAEHVPVL